jgi:hypothetical protein
MMRGKQLLDDLKEEKILELEEEALDCTLRRTRFGRAYGPAATLTTE